MVWRLSQQNKRSQRRNCREAIGIREVLMGVGPDHRQAVQPLLAAPPELAAPVSSCGTSRELKFSGKESEKSIFG